jgi:ketosteroid isomerase-like protein
MDEIAKKITELSTRWMRAWMDNDRATLEAMLAPDYALIVSSLPGRRMDRATWLATCERYRCTAFAYRDVQVRDLGGLAAMSAIADQSASLDGVDRSGSFWLTDLWRPGGANGWQVCARYSGAPEPTGASAAALRSFIA